MAIWITVAFIVLLLTQSCSSITGAFGGKIIGAFTKEGIDVGLRHWIKWTINTLHTFIISLFDNLESLIVANPPMEKVGIIMFFFIRVLQPFYILAVIVTAAYIMLISTSAESRARAKIWLSRLIIGLVIVSISPQLVEVMYYLSSSLAGMILNLGNPELGIMTLKSGFDEIQSFFNESIGGVLGVAFGGAPVIFMEVGLILILYLFIVMRYMIAGFFGGIFPLVVVLYTFGITRRMGKTLLDQSILWIFMPVAWALALLVIGLSATTIMTIAPDFPMLYISLASFLMLYSAPLIILGVMNWIGTSFFFIATVEAQPVATATSVAGESGVDRQKIYEEEVVIKPSWEEEE